MTNTTLAAKFVSLRTALKSALVERSSVVDSALAAILAGEHVLLLGAPGSGKSALARALCRAVDGASYFDWLLTKFSTVEEVLGPISLKALEQDRYERVVAGKLPSASIVFLDEIFKANSSILNALLAILNERIYHNGTTVISCPLISCIGASNEMPESSGLNALFDRFLVRHEVGYIVDRSSLKGMLLAGKPQTPTNLLTLADVQAAQADVQNVVMPDAVVDTLIETKVALEKEGIVSSDRRWQQILTYLRAVAWLDGSAQVSEDQFDVLADICWREPKERTVVVQVVGKIANPAAAKALEILDAAKESFNTAIGADPNGDRAKYLSSMAEANKSLGDAKDKLDRISDTTAERKRRRVVEASQEVSRMHTEIGRTLAKVLNLR